MDSFSRIINLSDAKRLQSRNYIVVYEEAEPTLSPALLHEHMSFRFGEDATLYSVHSTTTVNRIVFLFRYNSQTNIRNVSKFEVDGYRIVEIRTAKPNRLPDILCWMKEQGCVYGHSEQEDLQERHHRPKSSRDQQDEREQEVQREYQIRYDRLQNDYNILHTNHLHTLEDLDSVENLNNEYQATIHRLEKQETEKQHERTTDAEEQAQEINRLNSCVEELRHQADKSDMIINDLRSHQILRIKEETDSLHKENLKMKKELDLLKRNPTNFSITKDASPYHKVLVTQHKTAMKEAYDLKIANIRLEKDRRLLEMRCESYDEQIQDLRNRLETERKEYDEELQSIRTELSNERAASSTLRVEVCSLRIANQHLISAKPACNHNAERDAELRQRASSTPSVGELVAWIWHKYPPPQSYHDSQLSTLTDDRTKIKRMLLFYHPDKYSRFDTRVQIIANSVCKLLTSKLN